MPSIDAAGAHALQAGHRQARPARTCGGSGASGPRAARSAADGRSASDLGRLELHAVELQPVLEPRHPGRRQRALDAHQIFLFDLRVVADQPLRDAAILREHDEPGGVDVEPAGGRKSAQLARLERDGERSSGQRYLRRGSARLPAVAVLGLARHVADRLVEQDRDPLRAGADCAARLDRDPLRRAQRACRARSSPRRRPSPSRSRSIRRPRGASTGRVRSCAWIDRGFSGTSGVTSARGTACAAAGASSRVDAGGRRRAGSGPFVPRDAVACFLRRGGASVAAGGAASVCPGASATDGARPCCARRWRDVGGLAGPAGPLRGGSLSVGGVINGDCRSCARMVWGSRHCRRFRRGRAAARSDNRRCRRKMVAAASGRATAPAGRGTARCRSSSRRARRAAGPGRCRTAGPTTAG